MKIVQVIPTLDLAGAEIMVENLTAALTALGHTVLVVSLYDSHTVITDRLERADIKVYYLGKKRGLDLSVFKKLKKLLLSERPDVVHSHLYALKYAAVAAKAAGVPTVIHTIHNVAEKECGKADRLFNRQLYRQHIVVPVSLSEDVQNTVMREYGLSKAHTPVVFNGVPLEKCHPLDTYAAHAVKFLHVGRFSKAKNHDMLIRAFVQAHEQCPDIQLFLYGQGELAQPMRALVKEQGAEAYIHFCGLSNDIYSVMHGMDVFLLPSLYEGMPMTLIEAMGTGLPIIATKVGGIPDMLEDDKSALLCDNSPDAITSALSLMAGNESLRCRLGKAAKENANRFSASDMALSYLSIYKKELWARLI